MPDMLERLFGVKGPPPPVNPIAQFRYSLNVFGGLGDGRGMAHLENNDVVLEMQVRDGLFNVLESGVGTYRFPINELQSAHFKRGWFGWYNSVTFRASRMQTFEKIPGSDHGLLQLSVDKAELRDASDFVSQLNIAISENELKRLEVPH